MRRGLALLIGMTLLGAGCSRRHVAPPEQVRANHDRAWTIESTPTTTSATEDTVGTESERRR